MVDFSQTFVDPLPSRVTQQNPVVDRSGSIMVNTIANSLKGVGDIFDNIKTKSDNSKLGGIIETINKLGDNIKAGKVDPAVARRKIGVLERRYHASGGDPVKLATAMNKAFSGRGKPVIEKTNQEKIDDTLDMERAKKGFDTLEHYKDHLELKRKQEDLQRTINLRKSQLEFNAAERKEIKEKSRSLLADRVNLSTKMFHFELKKLVENYKAGKIDAKGGLQSIQGMRINIEKVLGAMANTYDIHNSYKEYAGILYKHLQVAEDVFSGKRHLDELTTSNKVLEKITEQNIMKDPRMGPLVRIINKLGGTQNSIAIQRLFTKEAGDFLVKYQELYEKKRTNAPSVVGSSPEDIANVKEYFPILKAIYGDINSVKSDEVKGQSKKDHSDMVDMAKANQTGVLKSVSDSEKTGEPVKNWKPVLDHFADPETATFFKNHPPDKELVAKASASIKNLYEKKILPGIKEHFNQEFKYFSPDKSFRAKAKGNIIGVWENGRVVFKVAPSSELNKDNRSVTGKMNNREAKQMVDKMNEDLAPIINQWIRVATHLDQSANKAGDYKKYYDILSENMYGDKVLEPTEEVKKKLEKEYQPNESDKSNKSDMGRQPTDQDAFKRRQAFSVKIQEITDKEAEVTKNTNFDDPKSVSNFQKEMTKLQDERKKALDGMSLNDAMLKSNGAMLKDISGSTSTSKQGDTVKVDTEASGTDDKTLPRGTTRGITTKAKEPENTRYVKPPVSNTETKTDKITNIKPKEVDTVDVVPPKHKAVEPKKNELTTGSIGDSNLESDKSGKTDKGVFDVPLPRKKPPVPKSFSALKDHIASKEAGKAGYDAVYHKSPIRPPKPVSTMTIGEAAKFQSDMKRKGSRSTAIGMFQFVQNTFNGVVKALGLKPSDKFDAGTQEQMALYLMRKRGLDKYIAGKLSAEDFANNLAMEWASMPVVKDVVDKEGKVHKAGKSYYAGDGLNASLTTSKKFLELVMSLSGKTGKKQSSNKSTKTDMSI